MLILTIHLKFFWCEYLMPLISRQLYFSIGALNFLKFSNTFDLYFKKYIHVLLKNHWGIEGPLCPQSPSNLVRPCWLWLLWPLSLWVESTCILSSCSMVVSIVWFTIRIVRYDTTAQWYESYGVSFMFLNRAWIARYKCE